MTATEEATALQMALKVEDVMCYAYLINTGAEKKLPPVLAGLVDDSEIPPSEILDFVIGLVEADAKMTMRKKSTALIVLKAIRHGLAESLL